MKEREWKELYKGPKHFRNATLRRTLGLVGISVLIFIGGEKVYSDGAEFKREQLNKQDAFIATYPTLPLEVREKAAQFEYMLVFPKAQFESLDRYDVDRDEIIRNLSSNDEEGMFYELQVAYDSYQEWEIEKDEMLDERFNKQISSSDVYKQLAGAALLVSGSLGLSLGLATLLGKRSKKKKSIKKAHRIIANNVEHPDNVLSSIENFKEFITKLQILPPVGGKIITFDKSGNHKTVLQRPTYLAEDLCDEVIKRQRKGNLGELYIHQLTVQGRLPDEFKYAALALILNSPYVNDWERPFFNSPWGSVAPLVHDGGEVDLSLNPNWKNSRGRTDFLQRMYVPGDDTDALGHEHNKMEEERMRFEARFYQRAALGLLAVCQNGTDMIEDEGDEQRRSVKKLTGMFWNDFIISMKGLFIEYGIEDVLQVPWINEKPRSIWSGHYARYVRYEADWDPIQKSLVRLEEVRQKHQIEIRERISSAISTFTNRVDFAIGLNAYLKKPEESEAA